MSPAEDNTNMIEIHAIFKGRVQGVGFRATIRQYASKLGLVGNVRNLADNSVEAYIQGPSETIQRLFTLLRSENHSHTINHIIEIEVHPLNFYLNFQILP